MLEASRSQLEAEVRYEEKIVSKITTMQSSTSKTVVALHRAAYLARARPQARVLLTTFSKALANALKAKLQHLACNEPAVLARITVRSITDSRLTGSQLMPVSSATSFTATSAGE